MNDPYALLAVAYFVLAFLSLLVLWALERVAELERKVMRIERETAKEHSYSRGEFYAPGEPAPPTILDCPTRRGGEGTR